MQNCRPTSAKCTRGNDPSPVTRRGVGKRSQEKDRSPCMAEICIKVIIIVFGRIYAVEFILICCIYFIMNKNLLDWSKKM